ncbi:nuclear factor related to kappa-B-binding protein [Diachasma alloeum]|uniref:nuclear factor related to kappa-B-binding protein n=1 Tax=Diachasma alloeum TaxID=454923 RepID=UPI0007381F6F|nr:nuclear factor related to kappa-B-binding protein [Diachasma alloeum]
MMEIDECSAGGDSGAEEEEDDESIRGSRTESTTTSSSGGSSSSESADDTGDEDSGSETHTSDDDDGDNDNSEIQDQRECVDEVRWETCVAGGSKVKLPQDLCEHPSILHEMLNPSLWQECLTEEQRLSLSQYLPLFPKDCDAGGEQEKSLQLLFQRENQRFGVAPLDTFTTHLSSGHYRPDIRRMRRLVRKAQQRRLLFDERKRTYELAEQLLKSRESLLITAYKQGFSQSAQPPSKLHWRKPKPSIIEERTQSRYLEELQALRNELGTVRLADTTSENEENYPQYQPPSKQKKKRKVQMGQSSIRTNQLFEDEDIRPVFSTLQRPQCQPAPPFPPRELTEDSYRAMLIAHKKRRSRGDIHPELNTQGIALSDLSQRAQTGQKHKLPGNAVKSTSKKRIKLEPPLPPIPPLPPMPLKPTIKTEFDADHLDDNFRSLRQDLDLQSFISIKPEPADTYEMPVVKKKSNPPVPKPPKPLPPVILPLEVKKEIEEFPEPEEKPEFILPEEHRVESEMEEELTEKKELDLENIDMLQIPIQLDDGMDILEDVKCENDHSITMSEREVSLEEPEDITMNGSGDLMQETHVCFFSLLRDAFMSKGEYRMSIPEVKEAVTLWQSNPISPLNDWYSLASSWGNLVPSALGFLAGELTYAQELDQERDQEFVPYLENKGRGVYAWIGAGRDSDSRLTILCTKFLLYKDSLGPHVVPCPLPVAPVKSTSVQSVSSANGIPLQTLSPVVESISADGAALTAMMESEPPKALCPTDWKVRLSTPEEREEFRRQERLRYAAPHKAFTYRMHGYASVVGPVKGIYQHNPGAGLTKARGHSLLVPDRPNFVTILALVRDATARLPNGEGTRADICMLLKDSQYIKDQSDQVGNDKDNYLNSVVSGALDRLHYETDPCVRYYPKKKEWLYLHRARSESEFEMFHQQLQGVVKTKKHSGGSSRNKSTQSSPKMVNGKEQSPSCVRETTPKKERKSAVQTQGTNRKEQRVEEKTVVDQSVSTEPIPVPTVAPAPPPVITTAPSVPVVTPSLPSPILSTPLPPVVEREAVMPVEMKPVAAVGPSLGPLKKVGTSIGGKPVTVVKTNPAQSLLQSNQHFPHHQIQVSTSAGLQTIRLSGHSVLHSAQPVVTSGSALTPTSVAAIFPTAKVQGQTQQAVVSNQGKSILQASSVKQSSGQVTQPQTQHVLPGKTLLASQIKLVSSGQIKSLLTGHGLQGQTIFIKQSSPGTSHTPHIQHVQQIKQPAVTQHHQSQPQTISTPGMQRIIAQIGGKPIAVQIQQSPHQQQTQQQKILAKVLTGAGGGQLISVESLLAQKGLKLAATTTATGQVNRQGKQVIQTQYQVVSQAQASPGQSKIIASTQQAGTAGGQTVRMVTAQLAGKPIVLASGNKSVGVGISSTGGMVLGKQTTAPQQGQQPIILPSQLLNIKTLHGLKVIQTPTGLKTGTAVYARVIAPTTIAGTQATNTQQQNLQPQPPRNTFNTP